MPSACVKLDKKNSAEAEEAIKQCLSVVEKKVRNLEKRKGKLDSYRELYEKGETELNDDQKDAIKKYDSVLRNLEFAKELQKQFQEINDKAEKLLRKKEKYDKQVKHNEEVVRIQELLQVQSILDSMGVDTVRNDFKTGKNGAVVLSEQSLEQLDELYKLISPTRDGETSYCEQLSMASEHIVNYLDGKDKEVAGTTYKQLKDLISSINQSGYFERSHEEQPEEATPEQEPQSEEPEVEEVLNEEQETEPDVTAVSPSQTQMTYEETQLNNQEQLPVQTLPITQTNASYPEDQQVIPEDSFFSTVPMGSSRGFQEIISSVQGSFNFLQESEIEAKKQKEVAHVDPAVVAAHPMGVSGLPVADPMSKSYGSTGGYTQNTGLLDDATAQYSSQQTQQNTSVSVSADASQSQYDSMSTPPTVPQSQSQYGQTSATYQTSQSDNAWSHKQETRWSTNTDGIDRSWGDQSGSQAQKWGETNPATSSSTQNQSWGEQAATPNQSWGDQGSQNWSTGGQSTPISTEPSESKTTSSLNPNADIFSMYQNQSSGFSEDGTSNYENTSRKDDYSQSEGYHSQGYRGRRDYDGNRGGFRGGRGGPRGGNTNGYQRGSSRGSGGGYRGNDDRRGYNDRGNRGSNRGSSSSFQAYYTRSNFQYEGGIQVMNNGFGVYDSGSKRGGPRGGGMRGGPRGGRGGSRGGGYGSRPSSAQHQ